jgi:hypothetical protein
MGAMKRLYEAMIEENIQTDTNDLGNIIKLVQAARRRYGDFAGRCAGCQSPGGECLCVPRHDEQEAA